MRRSDDLRRPAAAVVVAPPLATVGAGLATGVVLVTPKNLDEAGLLELLKPPIDEYLK